MNTTDTAWVHRHAGPAIQFECQDAGRIVELEYTTMLGKLPDADVWIVGCVLTETDNVANGEYWWPVVEYLAVYRRSDGKVTSRHATSAEVALFPASPDEEEEEEDEGDDIQ